jgi:hypothetical protein
MDSLRFNSHPQPCICSANLYVEGNDHKTLKLSLLRVKLCFPPISLSRPKKQFSDGHERDCHYFLFQVGSIQVSTCVARSTKVGEHIGIDEDKVAGRIRLLSRLINIGQKLVDTLVARKSAFQGMAVLDLLDALLFGQIRYGLRSKKIALTEF